MRTIALLPAFSLTKTNVPGNGVKVSEGDTVTYTITGTNSGNTLLDPVVITDDLPDVLDNGTLSIAPAATIEGVPAPNQPTLNGAGDTFTFIGSLAPS